MNESIFSAEYLFEILALISLGSTTTAALYHMILYVQRKEPILLQFCAYLSFFSLFTVYRLFLATPAGSIILYGQTSLFTLIDEPMQMMIYYTYIYFLSNAVQLKKTHKLFSRLLRYLLNFLLLYSAAHLVCISLQVFPARLPLANIGSRVLLVAGGMALIIAAWQKKKSTYYRYLLAGGLAFTICGLLAFTSFNFGFTLFGLSGLPFIFIGAFLDVLFFSAAVGEKLREAYLKVLQVRLKIAQDLHDQIGATLTSISFLSEVARKQITTAPEKAVTHLDRIGDYSREMISEMNDIVWTINPSNDRFDKLTDRMQNFALPILSSRKVEFEFRKDEKLQEVFLNMHQRKNVYLIFKEAIHNVAKYADCKEVKVRLGREKHLLKLDITDDGKGFNASGHSSGNGLKNMRSRAEELQGQLEVQSQSNRGTRISLEVPITQIAE